jgi:hypothetical protein
MAKPNFLDLSLDSHRLLVVKNVSNVFHNLKNVKIAQKSLKSDNFDQWWPILAIFFKGAVYFPSMIGLKIGSSRQLFFRLEDQFFYFTTLIQLPMAHLKITFSYFLNFLKKKNCLEVPIFMPIMEGNKQPL